MGAALEDNSKLQLSDFKPPTEEAVLVTFAKLQGMRPWFEERGYFPNHFSYAISTQTNAEFVQYSYPHFPYNYDLFETPPRIQLPYSNFGGDPTLLDFVQGQAHPLRTEPADQVVYAQDSQQRHVAMKLVAEGSVEYQVFHRLRNEDSLYTSDPEDFGCVIPPLDFLELYDGLWFVVMPRWGRCILMPEYECIGEILHLMRCLLKGLTVLHKNLIVHRDIKETNMVINHFSDQAHVPGENPLRLGLRSQNLLTYAWIDFDHGAIFPLDSKPAERRRPAKESFVYPCSRAEDASQGEIDYDPFVFDVGSLGFFLCQRFQWCSCAVPMLAPFLDRMITRDLATRFTAFDALRFFDEHVKPSVSEEILRSQPPPLDGYVGLEPEQYDRWAGLDPKFIEAWSLYQNPPLPRSTQVLRRICDVEAGRTCVRAIRKGARLVRRWTPKQ